MIVPLSYLFAKAREGGYALGYFEAWDSYSLEAVVEAAEAENSPVILGFGCAMVSESWLDMGGIESLGNFGRVIAERTRVPVAFLLNEAHTYEECLMGMRAGFNTVMLDTSTWPTARARQWISELVRVAHAREVAVEAELGHLPDATEDGIDASAATLTDPAEAAAFVAETGIDCLAVSIGNVHLLTRDKATIDLARLQAIHERVSIPLVIHGGTGFPAGAVTPAIRSGALKFNIGTSLKQSFFKGVKQALCALDDHANVHDILGSHREEDYLLAGKQAMQARVREFMRLYGSSGHARD